MRHFFTLISLFIFISSHSQVMWQVKNVGTVKWFLRECDEFTSSVLNTDKWQRSDTLLISKNSYKYGYFEMRFKSANSGAALPAFSLLSDNSEEKIVFYEAEKIKNNKFYIDVENNNTKNTFSKKKKKHGSSVKTNDSLINKWNIISGEWQADYIKFFLNGQPLGYFKGNLNATKNLTISNLDPTNNKDDTKFFVDYVRVWSNEDTIYRMKYNYKLFQYNASTIENSNLYSASVKQKSDIMYDKKALNNELGTITLLPVFYNRYSLSFVGNEFGKITMEVMDRFGKKVAGFEVENTEHYIMDLSSLPTGPYDLKINVLGQTLTENIPVLNAAKFGDQN